MRVSTRDREAFRLRLWLEIGGTRDQATAIANRLMRAGATYDRLQERACSVEMSEAQERRHEREEQRIERLVARICREAGERWIVKRDGLPVRSRDSGYTDGGGAWRGVAVFPSEGAAIHALHNLCPASADHAMRHEGYSIEKGPALVPVFQGDPRGHTIKLKVLSGYADDWGQTGLCVPTS